MYISDLNKKLSEVVLNSENFKDSKIVFGDGNTDSKIALVGEAPGGDEEKQGKPFVGAAGKNLSQFLEILELKRDDIYITNVVKIRPTKISEKTGYKINRTPNEIELKFFIPFLIRELKILKPKLIITLGNTPLRAITGNKNKIGCLHGKPLIYTEVIVFPLYHPASIIYNVKLKDIYLSDLKNLKMLIIERLNN